MVRFGPFILGENGPLYELPLIELTREGTYITFSEGGDPSQGDLFSIISPVGNREGLPLTRGALRKVVAVVKILRIEGERRALVEVLRGSVAKGSYAERSDRKVDLRPKIRIF